METTKLLVIDDDECIRKLLKTYFSNYGYDVETSDGGSDILNKIREFTPIIILMDLNMPGIGGQELARFLASTRGSDGCKLLVFSAEDEAIQEDMVKKGHADDYFPKCRPLKSLKEKVERLIDRITECCSSEICQCGC